MKRALLFAALTLVFACTKNSTESLGKLPVIIVNGNAYRASSFADDLGRTLRNFDALAAKDPTNVKRAKENAIREFIVSSLLTQYATAHQIKVDASEVDNEFNRLRKTYPDDLTFKASLASNGLTIDQWKDGLKKDLLERKVFQSLDPSSGKDDLAQARSYYENHKEEFEHPAQVHIEQIVVPREDDAERIYQKLKAGAAFSDMAKKFSISPDASKGGDIGYIDKGAVPAFEVAFTMNKGQMSSVIKSSYGFHIIKVLDKKPQGSLTFDQAKADILRQLATDRQQEAFKKWLDDSIKSAKIERNDSLIDKIRVRTEGEQE